MHVKKTNLGSGTVTPGVQQKPGHKDGGGREQTSALDSELGRRTNNAHRPRNELPIGTSRTVDRSSIFEGKVPLKSDGRNPYDVAVREVAPGEFATIAGEQRRTGFMPFNHRTHQPDRHALNTVVGALGETRIVEGPMRAGAPHGPDGESSSSQATRSLAEENPQQFRRVMRAATQAARSVEATFAQRDRLGSSTKGFNTTQDIERADHAGTEAWRMMESTHTDDDAATVAEQGRADTCYYHAALNREALREAGFENAMMLGCSGNAHGMAIFHARGHELPAGTVLPTNMKDWDPDLVVVDTWSELPPMQGIRYPDAFDAKMDTWRGQNRWVMVNDDDRVAPTHPGWKDAVLKGEKSIS